MGKIIRTTEEEITDVVTMLNMLHNCKQGYGYKKTKNQYLITVYVDEDNKIFTTFVFDKNEKMVGCYNGK